MSPGTFTRLVTISVLAFALVVHACTPQAAATTEARVRSALDMHAAIIDSAYGFAVDACIARETLVAEQAEAGKMTGAKATQELSVIRVRCHAARRAFDALRRGQDEAAKLVEAGKIEEASQRVQQIRAEWSELKENLP